MSKLDTIFKKPLEDYKITLNPIKDYFDMGSDFISTMTNEHKDEVRDGLKNFVKESKHFKNPKVFFYERDINGNKSKQISKLSEYLSYVTENDKIMVPSFTVYFNTDEKKSLHSDFIEVNTTKRSKHKKEAFKQKMNENFDLFNYHNTLQKSMKIFNNSLSGAYASAGTVLNNPSAHYTLTSITRCLSGIGNALSESIIAGNKHFKDPDTTLNHIITIVNDVNEKEIQRVMLKYKLAVPTPQEAMDAILKSSSKYWRNLGKERIIFRYLKNLSGPERAYVTYHNDMYHMRKYNDLLMRSIIDDMLNYKVLDIDVNEVDDAMNGINEWIYNFTMHILSERLVGKKKDDFTLADKQHIISISTNLNEKFVYYGDLFKTFFITNVFPVSIGTVKNLVRETIVLSDTDSTCASYSEWVHWYFGREDYSPKSIGVTAAVMTVMTQAVDHYIKLFGTNMNVKYKDTDVMEMKNEFFWKVFVNTNVSKHYFADVFIQEGNIYKPDKKKSLEKKGVHLIAPNAYQPIRDLAEELMILSMDETYKGNKLSLNYFIDKVLEAEELIMDKLKEASPDVLKLEKIKEAKSYKLEPNDSPYLHHMLWEEVFEETYGKAPDPTYMAIKIPTTINSKGEMKLFLDSLEDQVFAKKFSKFLTDKKKDTIKTFRLPLILIYNRGIPDEIVPIIDKKRVVLDNCKVLYIVLESLGFYLKESMTLTEMVS
jgi:hypothetical protein